ncbi:MAG TPA: methyltransferase domain-containing protein [Candidatus Dormibacteraeota bacterium]|nr:methyltransferase domain-containing protein [Candidatus Dormibacteraeota bacterium]
MDEIEAFYDRNAQNEWDRLDRHRTELAITLKAFKEYMPQPPVDVLDIGGGPGRYSISLAERGYKVTLLDLSKRCLEFAREKALKSGVVLADYRHGTALDLGAFVDDSFEVVLLMGPLYHLLDEDRRRRAIREARRVLKPNGLVFASVITRYAPFRWAAKNDPEWLEQVGRLLETGVWRPSLDGTPSGARVGFTDSYFADPVEIRQLMESEKFETLNLIACEGIISLIEEKINALDGRAFDAWIELNYRLSKDPAIHGGAEHLLYIGRKTSSLG